MLQQTRMEVALRYFDRFLQRFPTVKALAAASEDDVLTAWSGLGYYRRARMLRQGACDVMARFGGRIPDGVAELSTIAGVGRYTAGAIASIAFGRHAPIVDGNIARITARLAGIDHPVGSPGLMRAAWTESQRLVEACSAPREFNQGLMEIGALICTPRTPDCEHCPLTSCCEAFHTGRTDSLPSQKARAEVRHMSIPLYLVFDDRGRILMQRASGALMTSMFHLPHGSSDLIEGSALKVEEGRLLGVFMHTITNRHIEFRVMAASLSSSVRDSGEMQWVAPAAVGTLPHPSYVTKALRLAGL